VRVRRRFLSLPFSLVPRNALLILCLSTPFESDHGYESPFGLSVYQAGITPPGSAGGPKAPRRGSGAYPPPTLVQLSSWAPVLSAETESSDRAFPETDHGRRPLSPDRSS